MKAYGGTDQERTPVIQFIVNWMSRRSGLDALENKKISGPAEN
jgi:hypothetical protein